MLQRLWRFGWMILLMGWGMSCAPEPGGRPALNPGPPAPTVQPIMPAPPSLSPPAPSPSPSPHPAPHASTLPGRPITYVVEAGDTLWGIGQQFGVTVEALRQANGLETDWIYPGQVLVIPETATLPAPMASPSPWPSPATPWRFSPLDGDLARAYPETVSGSRFVMHITPGTWAAIHQEEMMRMGEEALAGIEGLLGVSLSGSFDLYVAGTLFAPPNTALRGWSRSAQRRVFILMDGSGDPADRRYAIAHELTHLVAYHTFGPPVSAMLSEGLAVYVGSRIAAHPPYPPLERLCRALLEADQLPSVARLSTFRGHIMDTLPYFASGCFVGYLIERYGAERFRALYPRGDYQRIYGKSLAELEAEWREALRTQPPPEDPDGQQWLEATARLQAAYRHLFAQFEGAPSQEARYRRLDAARIALWRGDVQGALAWLEGPSDNR